MLKEFKLTSEYVEDNDFNLEIIKYLDNLNINSNVYIIKDDIETKYCNQCDNGKIEVKRIDNNEILNVNCPYCNGKSFISTKISNNIVEMKISMVKSILTMYNDTIDDIQILLKLNKFVDYIKLIIRNQQLYILTNDNQQYPMFFSYDEQEYFVSFLNDYKDTVLNIFKKLN